MAAKMDKINGKISELLNAFENELDLIRNIGKYYLKYSSIICNDKSIRIGHNLIIAPENYMIVLYEGINKSWINIFGISDIAYIINYFGISTFAYIINYFF